MSNIIPMPGAQAPMAELPKPKKVPADWGLEGAVMNLVFQCGHVAAYNKLIAAAQDLAALIEREKLAGGTERPR